MASAALGIGLEENRPRRRGDRSKNSAPLRLCGRIHLMHRETPLSYCPWHRPLSESAWRRIARGDAETRRHGLQSSASLRLCGRIHLMHRETPLGGSPWPRPLSESAWRRIARGDAETRRHGLSSSAPLRLCGRIIPPAPGDPQSRVSRRNPLDLQPCESRPAACQHAVVADGMNAVLSTHATAVFVSSCLRVRHSQLPHPRDRRTRRCFI